MKLREYNSEDYDRVKALWQDCGFDLEEELESPDGLARTEREIQASSWSWPRGRR